MYPRTETPNAIAQMTGHSHSQYFSIQDVSEWSGCKVSTVAVGGETVWTCGDRGWRKG